MQIKLISQSQIIVLPEDEEDLFKLSFLLFDCTLRVYRSYIEKKEGLTKEQSPTYSKVWVLEKCKVSISKEKRLLVKGYEKGKKKSLRIRPNEQLEINKTFEQNLLTYLSSLKSKRIPYFAVEAGRFIAGYILTDRFVESYTTYFNLKDRSYTQSVKDHEAFYSKPNCIRKCSKIFKEALNRSTGFHWEELDQEGLLDWRSYISNQKVQSELLDQYFKKRSLCESSFEVVKDLIRENNFEKLVVTSKASVQMIQFLFETLTLEMQKKVTYLPHTERLDLFKEGVLLIRYF